MQSEIKDDVHLAQAVAPANHSTGGIKSIDIPTDFEQITSKMKKRLNRLLSKGKMDEGVTR